MHEWIDPDTGTIYELYYDVPQGNSDEREGVKYRVKDSEAWQDLPPFADAPQFIENDWFGKPPMLASTKSDIESIDKAIELLGMFCDGEATLDWKSAEPIFDALGDAREGLSYLSEKLPHN